MATEMGLKVAKIAENKYGYTTLSRGKCLWGVQNSLDAAGIKTRRVPSAYMAASAFIESADFNKYYKKTDSNLNLDTLPPGSIAVFNKTNKHPHGHVEIKSTSGVSWISDYRQLRRITYSGNKPMSIFIPK
jgi:hypothetical protein